MTTTTLHITVESTADFFEGALDDLRRMEAGEEMADKHVLSLPDEQALERVLNAKNLELLRTIAKDEPKSVRELARLVDRDVSNARRSGMRSCGWISRLDGPSTPTQTLLRRRSHTGACRFQTRSHNRSAILGYSVTKV